MWGASIETDLRYVRWLACLAARPLLRLPLSLGSEWERPSLVCGSAWLVCALQYANRMPTTFPYI